MLTDKPETVKYLDEMSQQCERSIIQHNERKSVDTKGWFESFKLDYQTSSIVNKYAAHSLCEQFF